MWSGGRAESAVSVSASALDGSSEKELFDRDKWNMWRRGFERCSRLEGLKLETRLAAESAWGQMSSLEGKS